MPGKLRAVLDTNVLIAGFISPHGASGAVLKALRTKRFNLVTSQDINEEVLEVMNRPRLREKYGLGQHLFDVAFILWEVAEVANKLPVVEASKDPDDNKFISAAIGGLAHYLVTNDAKDLLILREYEGVHIVTPEKFLEVLNRPS